MKNIEIQGIIASVNMLTLISIHIKTTFKGDFLSFLKFLRRTGTPQLVGIVISFVLSGLAVGFSSEYTKAVAVTYNNQLLGYVSNAEQADSIEETVRSDATGRGTADINFQYIETVVKKSKVASVQALSQTAIGRTVILDPNIQVSGLYIDNELVAVADNVDVMQGILQQLQQKYTTDGMKFDGFTAETDIRSLTVKQSENYLHINTLDEFLASDSQLGVKTHRTEEYDQTIKYSTEYSYDSTKDKSYRKIIRSGKNGLKRVVSNVSYINGQKVSSDTVSSTVLKKAVNAKVVCGSRNTTFQDIKDRLDALNAKNDGSKVTFIFPLEIRSAGYISSYWGDNRGHKGMDFASPEGTDIYAVADGVVTIATKSSSYGNYIEIEHKDGIRTRYAHASKLLVSKDEIVKQGDHIAEVGSTGRSTGNHLHFEVWKNDERVDPAPYLAIK